jgi:hypothetical protein
MKIAPPAKIFGNIINHLVGIYSNRFHVFFAE